MSEAARALQSDYMRFAKRETGARYNLAGSGVADCVMADLAPTLDDIVLRGLNDYGYAPLTERIAERFGIGADCVVTAAGASFANHLALAALLSPGDEVLVEDPTYELLISTLSYLGARVRRFKRRLEDGWRLDFDAVAAEIGAHTRLVVLTNLHNPSSAATPVEDVQALAERAVRRGAHVLVDEVYLELLADGPHAPTAFRAEGNVVVTSSLTKAYGLSGLRCGWILAPPPLAERMRRLNDLFAVAQPHVAERLSVLAFDRLDVLRARARRILEANRAAYGEILGGHPRLDQVVFAAGTTVFPRLRDGDGDALFQRLMNRFETSLVPGRFFGRPDHIRIGLGDDSVMTRAGLERVAEALEIQRVGRL